jgi:hypothetical protein
MDIIFVVDDPDRWPRSSRTNELPMFASLSEATFEQRHALDFRARSPDRSTSTTRSISGVGTIPQHEDGASARSSTTTTPSAVEPADA